MNIYINVEVIQNKLNNMLVYNKFNVFIFINVNSYVYRSLG